MYVEIHCSAFRKLRQQVQSLSSVSFLDLPPSVYMKVNLSLIVCAEREGWERYLVFTEGYDPISTAPTNVCTDANQMGLASLFLDARLSLQE